MPRPTISGNESKGTFVKAGFFHDTARDVYLCPAGEELTYCHTREQGGLLIRRSRINQCRRCPLQSRCTSGRKRRITRWEYEHLVDRMREHLRRDPDPETLRCCTVEHPFGTIKASQGATHFLTRALRGVRTEMALNVVACNIKRMVALIGIRRLMEAIPGWSRSTKGKWMADQRLI